jgi:predicted small lipoprotein YifL
MRCHFIKAAAMKVLAVIALAFGLAACGHPAPPALPPPSQTPQPAAAASVAPPAAPSVADLVEARASSGESEMGRRGYTVARQRGLTAYWWNVSARSCVQTVTSNGRYRTVQPVAASSCGH